MPMPASAIGNLYGVANETVRKVVREMPFISKNQFLGTHILGEFIECEYLPQTAEEVKKHFEICASLMNANIVESVFHEFNPYGLSGVVVISESHLAVHTWPEYRCMAVDLFSCGKLDPDPGWKYLTNICKPAYVEMTQIPRGTRVGIVGNFNDSALI